MGRFETLNPETQDVVEAILPAIASAFHVDDVKDIIPEDIRMRCWDCERRDHIKDQTEDDPRNWGVQFLKDLRTIARLNGGDVQAFQEMLRKEVATHEDKHQWARLADIKQIKAKLENPNLEEEMKQAREEAAGSEDEEEVDPRYRLMHLVEPEVPKGRKRKNRHQEMYEARPQPVKRKRLYRADGTGWERPEKTTMKRSVVPSREMSLDILQSGKYDSPYPTDPLTPSISARRNSSIMREIEESDDSLEVQCLQAEILEAELALKLSRLKQQLIKAKKAQVQEEAASRRGNSHQHSPGFVHEE